MHLGMGKSYKQCTDSCSTPTLPFRACETGIPSHSTDHPKPHDLNISMDPPSGVENYSKPLTLHYRKTIRPQRISYRWKTTNRGWTSSRRWSSQREFQWPVPLVAARTRCTGRSGKGYLRHRQS